MTDKSAVKGGPVCLCFLACCLACFASKAGAGKAGRRARSSKALLWVMMNGGRRLLRPYRQ